MESIGKEITLKDNKMGSILAGTTEEIRIKTEKILSKKETIEFFSKQK